MADAEFNEEEDFELEHLLAPLSRDQLEFLLARMIAKHPEELDAVQEEGKKPVDIAALAKTVVEALHEDVDESAPADNEEKLAQLMNGLELLSPLVARSKQYAKSGDVRNALSILGEVAGPVTARLAAVLPKSDGAGAGDGGDSKDAKKSGKRKRGGRSGELELDGTEELQSIQEFTTDLVRCFASTPPHTAVMRCDVGKHLLAGVLEAGCCLVRFNVVCSVIVFQFVGEARGKEDGQAAGVDSRPVVGIRARRGRGRRSGCR